VLHSIFLLFASLRCLIREKFRRNPSFSSCIVARAFGAQKKRVIFSTYSRFFLQNSDDFSVFFNFFYQYYKVIDYKWRNLIYKK